MTRFFRAVIVWTDALVAAHGGHKVETRDFANLSDALDFLRGVNTLAIESVSINTVN